MHGCVFEEFSQPEVNPSFSRFPFFSLSLSFLFFFFSAAGTGAGSLSKHTRITLAEVANLFDACHTAEMGSLGGVRRKAFPWHRYPQSSGDTRKKKRK